MDGTNIQCHQDVLNVQFRKSFKPFFGPTGIQRISGIQLPFWVSPSLETHRKLEKQLKTKTVKETESMGNLTASLSWETY